MAAAGAILGAGSTGIVVTGVIGNQPRPGDGGEPYRREGGLMPELARTCRLATGFILAGLISVVADGQDRSYDRDGVFRYDIIDMTSREVSVADARQIHYGSYRAYFRVFPFGTGPAGFYEEREPHKDFRLMHTVPDLVGKYRDRSVDYTEGWEGPDKLVVTHSSPGPGKIRRTRRILTRVETETTEWDGAWRLRVVDETASEELSGERVWIRYGDYVGFFWRAPDRLLYAIYAKQTEKNRFRILFSTREEEVGTILDHASEYQGGWDGVRWVESYVEGTEGNERRGHRMRVTFEAMRR